MKKMIIFPIEVPSGDYCWEYKPPHDICEHFDNEGGHPRCMLGLGQVDADDDGVRKATKCLQGKPYHE